MPWEKRGNNYYYYTGQRFNGRVVKLYYGKGEDAQKRAKVNSLQKLRAMIIKQHIQQEMDSLDELDRNVAQQAEIAELIARLALVEKGFHLHQRGEWRKRRR